MTQDRPVADDRTTVRAARLALKPIVPCKRHVPLLLYAARLAENPVVTNLDLLIAPPAELFPFRFWLAVARSRPPRTPPERRPLFSRGRVVPALVRKELAVSISAPAPRETRRARAPGRWTPSVAARLASKHARSRPHASRRQCRHRPWRASRTPPRAPPGPGPRVASNRSESRRRAGRVLALRSAAPGRQQTSRQTAANSRAPLARPYSRRVARAGTPHAAPMSSATCCLSSTRSRGGFAPNLAT